MKSKYLICQAVLRWQVRPRKNNSAYFSVPAFLSSRSYYVLDSNGVRHNLGGWTEPELAILRNTDSSSRISRGVNNKIFNKLQEAGFHRSKWAIASKRRELGLKRSKETHMKEMQAISTEVDQVAREIVVRNEGQFLDDMAEEMAKTLSGERNINKSELFCKKLLK